VSHEKLHIWQQSVSGVSYVCSMRCIARRLGNLTQIWLSLKWDCWCKVRITRKAALMWKGSTHHRQSSTTCW